MPRAVVTQSLIETLRTLRVQHKVPAKELAEHISKSPAYITKLEKGAIQTIDTKDLYSILEYISRDESHITFAEELYNTLTLKYTREEIEEQLWFINYDTTECLIPIPASLIEDLNTIIEELDISRGYLLDRINSNEALSEPDRSDRNIQENQWFISKHSINSSHSIKISMSAEFLDSILEGKEGASPYIFLLCIVYYLLKIKRFGRVVSISDDQNTELNKDAIRFLTEHKFLSISEKNKLVSEKRSYSELNEALSTFDQDNAAILTKIITGLAYYSNQDIRSANHYLQAFLDNMQWDLGFMLKLISFDYHQLDKTSFSNKKKLLFEIEALVNQYIILPEEQNRFEIY